MEASDELEEEDVVEREASDRVEEVLSLLERPWPRRDLIQEGDIVRVFVFVFFLVERCVGRVLLKEHNTKSHQRESERENEKQKSCSRREMRSN